MQWVRFSEQGFQPAPQVPMALMYGLCVYTTFRWPCSRELLTAHFRRLQHDAQALGLQWFFDVEVLEADLNQLSLAPGVFRVTVLPTVTSFGEPISEKPVGLMASFRAFQPVERFIGLKSVVHQRVMPGIKHGSMLQEALLRQHAIVEGYDDVLFVTGTGVFLEASTANVFVIRHGQLHTPDPANTPCLPGLTRHRLLQVASQYGIAVSSQPVGLGESLEGCFLSNAVQGLYGVESIDKCPVAWNEQSLALFRQLKASIG